MRGRKPEAHHSQRMRRHSNRGKNVVANLGPGLDERSKEIDVSLPVAAQSLGRFLEAALRALRPFHHPEDAPTERSGWIHSRPYLCSGLLSKKGEATASGCIADPKS